MTLVNAYDIRTGQKLPHRVRDSVVNHEVLGEHLSLTPREKSGKRAAPKQPAPVATNNPTETPAAGDEGVNHAAAL